jgi:hypothetical protein
MSPSEAKDGLGERGGTLAARFLPLSPTPLPRGERGLTAGDVARHASSAALSPTCLRFARVPESVGCHRQPTSALLRFPQGERGLTADGIACRGALCSPLPLWSEAKDGLGERGRTLAARVVPLSPTPLPPGERGSRADDFACWSGAPSPTCLAAERTGLHHSRIDSGIPGTQGAPASTRARSNAGRRRSVRSIQSVRIC